jgi:hypothetical protein
MIVLTHVRVNRERWVWSRGDRGGSGAREPRGLHMRRGAGTPASCCCCCCVTPPLWPQVIRCISPLLKQMIDIAAAARQQRLCVFLAQQPAGRPPYVHGCHGCAMHCPFLSSLACISKYSKGMHACTNTYRQCLLEYITCTYKYNNKKWVRNRKQEKYKRLYVLLQTVMAATTKHTHPFTVAGEEEHQ